MKKLFANLVLALLAVGISVAQQAPQKPPSSASEVLDRQFSNLEKDFVPAAEAMPADKYDFAPTTGEFKGVRTFGQQVKHVATTNYSIASALLGEKSPVDTSNENGPDEIKTKEQIVKLLKDSFAYSHKAIATLTDKNLLEPVNGRGTHLGSANLMIWHSFDHYGQMVEYLRMNGIIPPASRK
jgi:uncharacterized damage-inducible protein DinB